MSRVENVLAMSSGALLGSVLGSVITLALVSDEEPKPEGTEEAKGAPQDVSVSSHPEVARLTQRLKALERRVSLLTFAQPHSSPTKPAAHEGEPKGAANQRANPRVVDDPVFEAAVRDVVDRVEFERDEQRDVDRAERRRAAADRWAVSLGSRLELTEAQMAQVNEVMTKHFEKLQELRNADESERPILRSEWRQRIQDLRGEAEKNLETVFDPQQREKYNELDQTEKLSGFASRGRPRRRSPR